jgi:two-component system LytT family response regulator
MRRKSVELTRATTIALPGVSLAETSLLQGWPSVHTGDHMRLIVVEDEPIARDGLFALLSAEPLVEVVGSFASADTARRGIHGTRPDAMFVDVEMPGEGGVDLVRSIPPASRPHVVFVTAHENYAAEAFDVEAVDYVLKPIDERRMTQAVERVRKVIATNARLRESVNANGQAANGATDDDHHLKRISARVGDKLVVMKLSDVSWIEADGDYMRIHSKGRVLLVRMTMRELELRLDPASFIRAHRSAVVNVDSVASVDLLPHGEHVATLCDGARVRIGRTYRPALFAALGERA